MAANRQKTLIVEGKDDCYTIAQLMGKHVQWGDHQKEWPVYIECAGSASELLEEDYVPTLLLSSTRELKILGIVMDANDSCGGRWQRLFQLCRTSFPDIPQSPPKDGLVITNAQGKKLGIWIMPDNSSKGMTETFLQYLVPQDKQKLWEYVKKSVSEAKSLGAPYKEVHIDKANIHTWLAWQDQPGQSMSTGLLSNCFDTKTPYAKPFIDWFCKLYELPYLNGDAQTTVEINPV